MAVTLALLAGGGCASLVSYGHDTSPQRLFTVGYENLQERYIESVDLGEISVAGLNRLSALDPDLGVSQDDGRVTLSAGDSGTVSWNAPGREDADGWANLTAQVLIAAHSTSPVLQSREISDLSDTVFRGVMGELDRYSRYADPTRARRNRAMRDGFGGLGISIRYADGATIIDKVHHDTPAERAGLKANDRIILVDGVPTAGQTAYQVVDMLRGSIDSRVVLEIARPPEPAPREVSLVRALIVVPTVAAHRERGILTLKVTGFNQATTQSMTRELKRAEREMGKGLRGIILDLRDNPGGLLQQAVAVSDLFLDDGLVISTKGRHPKSHQTFDAEADQLVANVPIVVLVNGKSASAAEIVAAALRDRGRAVLLGSSSFGKGTVQTIIRLPNGGEMILTWARMHSPSGSAIHGNGVLPMICTSAHPGRVEKLVRELQSDHPIAARALLEELRTWKVRQAGPQKARAACPPNKNVLAADAVIARHVLLDRGLYTGMLGGQERSVAHAPVN